MRSNKFVLIYSVVAGILFVCFSAFTIILDPLFHYHGPLKGLSYQLNDERYQNNGIGRHFEYNAIITGTSETENFKSSLFDELFAVNSVKMPYAGGSLKEIGDNLKTALNSHPDVQLVVLSLDEFNVIADKDAPFHGIADSGYKYPWYLVDGNLLTDVKYLLNKEIFISKTVASIDYILSELPSTTFDDYGYWANTKQAGKDNVIREIERGERTKESAITDGEIEMVKANIRQNIVDIAENYPETVFCVFFPPYSVCYWDKKNLSGELFKEIDAYEKAAELLLSIENIKVYNFMENFELVSDLDKYYDESHYCEEINDEILLWMKDGDYLLEKNEIDESFEKIKKFYGSYDYDAIYE